MNGIVLYIAVFSSMLAFLLILISIIQLNKVKRLEKNIENIENMEQYVASLEQCHKSLDQLIGR